MLWRRRRRRRRRRRNVRRQHARRRVYVRTCVRIARSRPCEHVSVVALRRAARPWVEGPGAVPDVAVLGLGGCVARARRAHRRGRRQTRPGVGTKIAALVGLLEHGVHLRFIAAVLFPALAGRAGEITRALRPGVLQVVAFITATACPVLIRPAILATILITWTVNVERQRVAFVARATRHIHGHGSWLASRAVRPLFADIVPAANAAATVPVVAVVIRAARLADTSASQCDREARRRAQDEATQNVLDGRTSKMRSRRVCGAPSRGNSDHGRSQRPAHNRHYGNRDRPGESPGAASAVRHRAPPLYWRERNSDSPSPS